MGLTRLFPRPSAGAAHRSTAPAALLELDEPPAVTDSEAASDGDRRFDGPREARAPVEAVPAVEEAEREAAWPAVADTPAAASAAPAATRIIVLANQKGGVAKTTTTLNLGVALQEMGHRVLLIDLDPQGNLTMSQGMNPDVIEKSMFDVLVHRIPISDVIERVEIDLAVASIDLAGAELALSSLIGRERALQKALVEVRSRYDFILVDTPPSLGLLTINAFVAATGVIVPVQCEYLSLRGLVQLENTLAMVRENLNPDVNVEGIVATMFDGRTLHSREAVEILEENFGDLVFTTRIRKTIRYAEAPVKGSSVLRYDPTGSAAEAYRELAREVLGKEVLHGAQAREHA
ncbi:MAG: ParA family protein [Actinobacteria bacterium]|nr:ParA family protein [Actinomycetota bacterium]